MYMYREDAPETNIAECNAGPTTRLEHLRARIVTSGIWNALVRVPGRGLMTIVNGLKCILCNTDFLLFIGTTCIVPTIIIVSVLYNLWLLLFLIVPVWTVLYMIGEDPDAVA